MKETVRDGRKIIVFDNIEEMKWHFHARLCKDSSDNRAVYITRMYELGIKSPKEANKHLKLMGEPCEVKT
jgi:hypothetical protein